MRAAKSSEHTDDLISTKGAPCDGVSLVLGGLGFGILMLIPKLVHWIDRMLMLSDRDVAVLLLGLALVVHYVRGVWPIWQPIGDGTRWIRERKLASPLPESTADGRRVVTRGS